MSHWAVYRGRLRLGFLRRPASAAGIPPAPTSCRGVSSGTKNLVRVHCIFFLPKNLGAKWAVATTKPEVAGGEAQVSEAAEWLRINFSRGPEMKAALRATRHQLEKRLFFWRVGGVWGGLGSSALLSLARRYQSVA